ncbi:MAG: exodeoxyribonuclease VII small subunit [Clostridia bacterium]|nr:exodeoxyribonuclease VII small subunit [Clostridia bacterium]
MAEGLTFEEAMKRLEAIVRHLEGGELPLEEALTKFEEGVGLVRYCRERLAAAERRLELLVEREDGTATCQTWADGPGESGEAPRD